MEEPTEASAASFDDIPRVHSVQECACWAVRILGRQWRVAVYSGIQRTLALEVIGFPWEGPQVEYRKNSHLDASKRGGDTDAQIRPRDLVCCLQGATFCCQERDDPALPEAEEDDQLDTQHLQERSVWRQIFFQLDVKLYNAVHGDGHRCGFEASHPYICIARILGARAVATLRLCDYSDDSHGGPDEAVLEDADPDNLQHG